MLNPNEAWTYVRLANTYERGYTIAGYDVEEGWIKPSCGTATDLIAAARSQTYMGDEFWTGYSARLLELELPQPEEALRQLEQVYGLTRSEV